MTQHAPFLLHADKSFMSNTVIANDHKILRLRKAIQMLTPMDLGFLTIVPNRGYLSNVSLAQLESIIRKQDTAIISLNKQLFKLFERIDDDL